MRSRAPVRWLIAAAIVGSVGLLLIAFAASGNDEDEPEEATESSFQQAIRAAPQRLRQLPSYAYETTLAADLPGAGSELGATTASARAEGEVIPPDRLQQTATTTLGSISADEELVRLPEGDFIRRPDGYVEGLGELDTFVLSAPSLWDELAGVAQLFPADPEGFEDQVDGVACRRYEIAEVRLLLIKDHVLRLFGAVSSAKELPDFYEVELCLAVEDDTLLRVSIRGERTDAQERLVSFELNSSVTDIGDNFAIELE